MNKNKNFSLHSVSWNDVRNKVHQANNELANILDSLDLKNSDQFVLAEYPFGKDILKAGEFVLPISESEVAPISDSRIPKAVSSQLNYAHFPVGLLLNNTTEVYYETSNRIISDKIWYQGTLFGIWELLDKQIKKNSTQLSSLSAGARSIFLLPKISDQTFHNRLKKEIGIETPPPEKLSQHRDLFSDIVSKLPEGNKWKCKILFFGKKLINKLYANGGYKLLLHFAKETWNQSFNCRRQFESGIFWEKMLQTISASNLYLQPRIYSHLKQIFFIHENTFPGMVFSSKHSNKIAPINLLQKVYSEIYKLKNYAPIFAYPGTISKEKAVYYSLNYPNYFDTNLPTKTQPRLTDELRIIKEIVNLIINNPEIETKPHFTYFHAKTHHDDGILPSENIITHEQGLSNYFAENKGLLFPSNSPFFKGCIRIS